MRVICAKCRKQLLQRDATVYVWQALTDDERKKYGLTAPGDHLCIVTCPKHGRVNVVMAYKDSHKTIKYSVTLLVHTKGGNRYRYFPPLSWFPEKIDA